MREIEAVGRTSIGLVRALNEDAWYAGERLFVVADGMGGHAAGDVASAVAIDHLVRRDIEAISREDLRAAVLEANSAVLDYARTHPEAAGLGSTVCGLARTEAGWLVFNAGDSRCYAIERGTLRQVTLDHSEVQELIDVGLITKEQARVHPDRNVITRAIGQVPPPAVDFFALPAGLGARFVLASDGLHSEIDDAEIARICAQTLAAHDLASALVRAAEEAGGHDNVTVIVVDDLSEPDPSDPSDPEETGEGVTRTTSTTVPRDLVVREVAQ